jgi:hypothetical protein
MPWASANSSLGERVSVVVSGGNVAVSNFPLTQPVSGIVDVGNFPATQAVSGTVAVGNEPTFYCITGPRDPCSGTSTVTFAGNGEDTPVYARLAGDGGAGLGSFTRGAQVAAALLVFVAFVGIPTTLLRRR